MEQSSILSAKRFDCPVAHQNLSLLATAHDCETGISTLSLQILLKVEKFQPYLSDKTSKCDHSNESSRRMHSNGTACVINEDIP